jgi:hydroxyethylthiazole kinase-like uncharacterized protein yjeF
VLEISRYLPAPADADNKYTRGVVGFVTGSNLFPGAAMLGVSAAIRCGAGLVRYIGPRAAKRMVLENRPEAVAKDGPADVWVIGSGVEPKRNRKLAKAFETTDVAVVDAGALALVDFARHPLRCVLTPHVGELASLFIRLGYNVSTEQIDADPRGHAIEAAIVTDCVVLLKGHYTFVATPNGDCEKIGPLSSHLATAGSGDVLAGILGSVFAQNKARIVESENEFVNAIAFAVRLHSEAADHAARTGTVAALDIIDSLQTLIGQAR